MFAKKVSHYIQKNVNAKVTTKHTLTALLMLIATSAGVETSVTLAKLDKPTEISVLRELKRLGVRSYHIVLAQSKLETGHYKSKVLRTHNNLFGFRTKKGYIKFAHWRESVAYYKKWQDKRYKRHKYANYYEFLTDIGYAEDPQYTNKLRKIQKR